MPQRRPQVWREILILAALSLALFAGILFAMLREHAL
jgi:hypothetical protein